MAIMDLIRKFKGNKEETSKKFKEMQEDRRLQKILEEREKSSNRRELERYYREKEEKMITEKLKSIRKRENEDMWSGKTNILKGHKNILRNDRPILKQKNLFSGHLKENRIPFLGGGGMKI